MALQGHIDATRSDWWRNSKASDRSYSPRLQSILRTAADSLGFKLPTGVYAQLTGPCYETPAEIRMLRTIGAEWWRTDATFAQRIAHLKTGGGLNGSAVLTAATIDNDSAADQLYGQGGNDWFLAPASEIKDFAGGDDRTLL